MTKQIEENVRKILKENVRTPVDIVSLGVEQSLSEAGFNSLDFIKVAVGIEAEFEFEFSDEDLNSTHFDSIQKIVSFIESKSAALANC